MALGYLRQEFPDVEWTRERVPKLVAALGADIVRIRDPHMYGHVAVVAGGMFKASQDRPLMAAVGAELQHIVAEDSGGD